MCGGGDSQCGGGVAPYCHENEISYVWGRSPPLSGDIAPRTQNTAGTHSAEGQKGLVLCTHSAETQLVELAELAELANEMAHFGGLALFQRCGHPQC